MMNLFAKCLLVSTSLSPVLGAMAVYQFERGEPWTCWIWWLAVAVLLVILCWLLLRYMAQNGQRQLFEIREFERKDQELLAFLFIYLLPFVRSEEACHRAPLSPYRSRLGPSCSNRGLPNSLELFGDVFDNEPARRHFAEFTGLMVAERRQSPIRRHHGSIMPQSLAGECGGAQRPPSGVTGQPENPLQPPRRLAIDSPSITADIEDVGWLWDHAQQRHGPRQMISNYVCPSVQP